MFYNFIYLNEEKIKEYNYINTNKILNFFKNFDFVLDLRILFVKLGINCNHIISENNKCEYSFYYEFEKKIKNNKNYYDFTKKIK